MEDEQPTEQPPVTPQGEQPPIEAVPPVEEPPVEVEPQRSEQLSPPEEEVTEVASTVEQPAADKAPEEPSATTPDFDSRRAERPEDRPERRRGGFRRRKVCGFCVDKVRSIDYKDPARLRRYLSDRGRIEPRRKTGTCAKHQRWLTTALKRARHLALLPYTSEHIRGSGTFGPRR